MKDKIVESVIEKFSNRSDTGIEKYGTTLNREDLSTLEWLNHLQEELMDATLYIEKLKSELNRPCELCKQSWESAEKITHDGYVYVRYKDISSCK